MRHHRLAYRAAYTVAISAASIVLGMDFLRDMAATPYDPALTIILILMAFGTYLMLYGLYLDRHKFRARAVHRLKIRQRFARRRVVHKPVPASRPLEASPLAIR
jgi:hypothetical protein